MIMSKQKGFTLVEMLVALMIAGIFFSIFVGVVLATFETLRSGDERTVAQQNARVALNFIANDIRHAREIAPLRLEAYRDWADGGFPMDIDTEDPFDENDAWPIFRRSVDSDVEGYIDLDIEGGSGDGYEYETFRSVRYPNDIYPYDVRPLATNRLSLLFYGTTYYPNTRYWSSFGTDIDLDGNRFPNPTAALTRVTYEHQLVEPLHPEIYEDEFSGRVKQFNMVVNRTNADAVQDTSDFVVVRSFEMDNPRYSGPRTGETNIDAIGPLGNVSDQLMIDEPYLRQPVADHVINLRFRYWYIQGNRMIEIRYDPNEDNIGGNGIDPADDGYYRYFDISGTEIYVFYSHEEGQEVPIIYPPWDDTDIDDIPDHSFVIFGIDQNDRYEQGILLFEGWRFVNTVSISVKTANNQTLEIFRSSINQMISNDDYPDYDPTHPDYGMGFIDFGLADEQVDTTGSLNSTDPLYQAADNLRMSTTPVNGVAGMFDFVEPNMNPNFNASAFTTLQTFVNPPALQASSEAALRRLLTFGFWVHHEY